jgi:hypothetical protein
VEATTTFNLNASWLALTDSNGDGVLFPVAHQLVLDRGTADSVLVVDAQ